MSFEFENTLVSTKIGVENWFLVYALINPAKNPLYVPSKLVACSPMR